MAAKRTMRRRWIAAGAAALMAAVLIVGAVTWPPPWRTTTCDWWLSTSPYSYRIVVGVEGGIGGQTRVDTTETSDTVQVVCWTREPKSNTGPGIMIAVVNPEVVNLKSPLNDRRVVDQNGTPIPEKPGS